LLAHHQFRGEIIMAAEYYGLILGRVFEFVPKLMAIASLIIILSIITIAGLLIYNAFQVDIEDCIEAGYVEYEGTYYYLVEAPENIKEVDGRLVRVEELNEEE
jgi:hypothetical protein